MHRKRHIRWFCETIASQKSQELKIKPRLNRRCFSRRLRNYLAPRHAAGTAAGLEEGVVLASCQISVHLCAFSSHLQEQDPAPKHSVSSGSPTVFRLGAFHPALQRPPPFISQVVRRSVCNNVARSFYNVIHLNSNIHGSKLVLSRKVCSMRGDDVQRIEKRRKAVQHSKAALTNFRQLCTAVMNHAMVKSTL